MKITEDDLEIRKSQIIRRAFRLFCQKGIDCVTMKEIAAAARVGVASVYRYFNTKAALLEETQKLLWKECQNSMREKLCSSDYPLQSGYDQIRLFLDAFEAVYQEHSEYFLFAAQFKSYLIREGLQLEAFEHAQMLEPVSGMLYDAIRKGRRDGSITGSGDLEDIFYTIWGVMRALAEEIVICDKMLNGKNQWKGRQKFVNSMLLSALGTMEKGSVFSP